jgi:hypothetical protein
VEITRRKWAWRDDKYISSNDDCHFAKATEIKWI